jgi:hypothetical protein
VSANTTGDEYSRGRAVADRQQRQPSVNPLYRPIIIVVWAIGVVLAFVTTLFAGFPQTTLFVVGTAHLCLAGLVQQDIKSIRKQGVDWGHSRHLWFGATIVFPLMGPLYYLYSGRVVARENERRKRKRGLSDDTADATDTVDDEGGTSADADAADD